MSNETNTDPASLITRENILAQLVLHGAVSVDRDSPQSAIVKELIDDGIVQITTTGLGWYEVKTLVSILAERDAEIERLEEKIEQIEQIERQLRAAKGGA